MNRFFFFLFLLGTLCLQSSAEVAGYWQKSGEITLKKDQEFTIKLNLNTESKNIVFHWTLYKNSGLVVVLKYDGFVKQFVLYKDHQRESYKLKLLRANGAYEEAPFMLLSFKEYERKNKTATLEFRFRAPSDKLDIIY